ncbi:MAG: hypothetical protein ACRENL_11565 [Candidatus Dormibacteria bacterium]
MTAAIVIAALVLMTLVVWALGRRAQPPHGGRADSDLRDAFIGILMTVGPFFGVRYRPPRVEVPVAAAPAPEDLDPATAAARPGDEPGEAPPG